MDSDTQHGTDTRDTGRDQHSSSGSEKSQSLAEQLRQQASTRFSGEKDRAIQGLTSLVEAVRQTGQQLRDKDQAGIATYIDSAADQAARFSEQLGNKDLGEIVDDLQRFAHRRPALFLGLSFGIGVASARFLKSSRPRPQGYRSPNPGMGNLNRGGGSPYAATGSAYGATGSTYGSGSGAERPGGTAAGNPAQRRMAIAPPPASPSTASTGTRTSGGGTSSAGHGPDSAIGSTPGSTDKNDTIGVGTGEISRGTAAPRPVRRPRTEQ